MHFSRCILCVRRSMYTAIIGGHLGQGNFEAEVARLGPALVNATLDLHAAVANTFLPSAVKFQYQFNLRELSAIAQVGATHGRYSLDSSEG